MSELAKILERRRTKCSVPDDNGNGTTAPDVPIACGADDGRRSLLPDCKHPAEEDAEEDRKSLLPGCERPSLLGGELASASGTSGLRIADLERELEQVRAEVRELRSEKPARTDVAHEIQAPRRTMQERERLQFDLAQVRRELDDQRKSREAVERELTVTRKKVSALEQDGNGGGCDGPELACAKRDIVEQRKMKEAVERDLLASRRNAETLARDLSEARTDRDRLEQSLQDLHQQLGDLSKETEILKKRSEDLENELEITHEEIRKGVAAGFGGDPAGPGGTLGEAVLPGDGSDTGGSEPRHSQGDRSATASPDAAAAAAAHEVVATIGVLEHTLAEVSERSQELEAEQLRRRALLARVQAALDVEERDVFPEAVDACQEVRAGSEPENDEPSNDEPSNIRVEPSPTKAPGCKKKR